MDHSFDSGRRGRLGRRLRRCRRRQRRRTRHRRDTTLVNQVAFLRAEPQATSGRTVSYQVGAAGTATLTIANGSLTIDSAEAGTGWIVTSASGSATHAEAQFTDGTELVTFGADLAGTDVVVVSLTNIPVVAPVAVVSAEPIKVAVAQGSAPAGTITTTSPPQAAMPASTVAPAAIQPPTTSATTAPSGSGESDGHEGDYETESDDD